MSKKKKLILSAGIIVFLCFTFVAVRNFQNFGKRAKSAEARNLATELRTNLEIAKSQSGVYPETVTTATELHYYKWGAGESVKAFCPDCEIRHDSFKIAIYGNIDSDPDLDVWVMESADLELKNILTD